MAQLKAGSTAGGVAIQTTTANSWPYEAMSFNTAPGISDGYIKKSAGDTFEVVSTANSSVVSQAQGANKSFISGGVVSTFGSNTAVIDTFPFTSPFTTATSVGNLSQSRGRATSQSSSTNGYTSGGVGTPTTPPYPGPSVYQSTIDSFPFTSPFTAATSVGNLSLKGYSMAGISSTTSGYAAGARYVAPFGILDITNNIDSFPFSAPFTTATQVGVLGQTKSSAEGHASPSKGFTSGGFASPVAPTQDVTFVETFPFSAPPIGAVTSGDLISARGDHAATTSSDSGFVSGGWTWEGTYRTTTEKFPFAAPFVTATSVGSATRVGGVGTSGITQGYVTAGVNDPQRGSTISTCPFATVPYGSLTTSGDLSSSRGYSAGQQY